LEEIAAAPAPAPARSFAGELSFPKARRVLKRADFLRAQRGSTSARGQSFVLIVHHRADDDRARLGIIASRKSGNAVQRNRSKRMIREWFRTHGSLTPPGIDVLVIVRRGSYERQYGEVCGELSGSLKHALSRKQRRTGGRGDRR
jgi:ribonuclease P protein component